MRTASSGTMKTLIIQALLWYFLLQASAEHQFNQWWHVQTFEETYTINNIVLKNRFNLFYHDVSWYNATCDRNEIIEGNKCYQNVYRKWLFEPKVDKRGIKVSFSR